MAYALHKCTNSLLRGVDKSRRSSYMAVFRRLVTFCLLLALLLQTFSKLVVIADFCANQDAIARNLCINRKNSTAISCYGTCQLSKRLQQENKDSSPERKPDNSNETISSRSFYLTGFNPYRQLTVRRYPASPSAHPIDQPSAHFHPPGC